MLYYTDVNEHGTGEIGLAINSGRTSDFSGIDYDFGYNATALFPPFGFPTAYAPGLSSSNPISTASTPNIRIFSVRPASATWSVDARYDSFLLTLDPPTTVLDCTGSLVSGAAGQKADYSCLPFQYTAKHLFSVNAHYTLPLPDSIGKIIVGGNFTYTGPSYDAPNSLPSEEPYAWLDAASVANFTIDWKSIAGSSIDAQLFVTNAFDELDRISNSNVSRTTYDTTAIFGAPRMFGGQIKYRFGSFAD